MRSYVAKSAVGHYSWEISGSTDRTKVVELTGKFTEASVSPELAFENRRWVSEQNKN